jgi:polyisoprenoid-binding protein YceI
MTRAIFFAVGVLLLSVQVAAAAHWNVDYSKSSLGFTVLWSSEPFSAKFKSWKADIDFDPADLKQARASVVVDLASEASDESDFDENLKGAQGFQLSQFPAARFVTESILRTAGNDYVATGDLILKGITRRISLPFNLTISGSTAHMIGSAKVIRTDFGVGLGQWAAPEPVAREVTVSIDLTATR